MPLKLINLLFSIYPSIRIEIAGPIEYISSIDTEIRKSGKQTITFQKSDLFSGQGLMFNALNSKCSDVVIDLMQLKRLSVEKDFI